MAPHAEVAFTLNRHGPFCQAAGEEQKEVAEEDIKVRSLASYSHGTSSIVADTQNVFQSAAHAAGLAHVLAVA